MWINIDIDNTINNFLETFIYHINDLKLCGERHYDVNDFTDYNFVTSCGLHRDTLNTLFFNNPRFFEKMKVLDNCEYVIKKLYEQGHEITFVTARDYRLVNETITFLIQHFNFISELDKRLIFSQTKENIWADVVIEDYIPNLCNCNPNCNFILFDRPWNRDTTRTDFIRFYSWDEIPGIINNIEKSD